MKLSLVSTLLGLSLIAPACVTDEGDPDKPDQSDVKGGPDGKAEAWGTADRPELFNANLEYLASALPASGEAQNIPWAGNYWPVYEDSINKKWGSGDPASTKYARAFGATGVEDAVSRNHGIESQSSRTACTQTSQCNASLGESCSIRTGQTSGRCIPTWFGICHAWAPAAILLAEPKHAVTHNGVDFKVQDIKALVTLVHDRTNTKFVSLRCNGLDSANEITFDKYGRPNGSSLNCIDTNPGTFHVLMTNYLGKMRQSFVYDRTWDSEVWNQPLRGYRITSSAEVSPLEANKLVGVTAEGGTTTEKTGTTAAGAWTQVGTFNVTAGSNLTVAMTGSGDPDMYVQFGSQPTASAYACRPYEEGAVETCTLTVPAGATQAFVAVNAYGTAAANYTIKVTSGGSIPTNYLFNANAKKLLKVHMDVDFIAESPAGTDGNLGSTINSYTHVDRYDYILELDAAGKIIGGEWIGTSKRQHPDFVWLPLSSASTSVAGGKITYANVMTIYELSMRDTGGGTTGGVKTVNDSGAIAKDTWKHLGPYNVAAGTTLTAVMTGDGDADLYARKNASPTTETFDCRPYQSGSNEQCSIVGPAVVYVSVRGYAATSNYQLKVTYTEGTGGGTTPPPVTTFTHLNQTGSVTQGQMKVFELPMPAGKKVVIRTTSSADVDLYVQFGAAPTTNSYVARGYTTSGNEAVTYTATGNGVLYVGVHGYAAGSFTVKSTDL